jgi:hypothetical protein
MYGLKPVPFKLTHCSYCQCRGQLANLRHHREAVANSLSYGRPQVPRFWAPGIPRTPARSASAWTASPPTTGGCRSFPSPGAQSIHELFIQPRPPSVPQSLSPSVPRSLSPSVPRSLGPSVPWSLRLTPHPPLWKSASILHGFSRKTHGFNRLSFLSVN